MAEGMLTVIKRFPRVYWVAQIFELLERGAYYTMIPIIAVHAYYNIGVSFALAATITAFMYAIQDGLPILTGALGEKFGYRKQIIFAFIFLTVGYLILFLAKNVVLLFVAVIAIGIGIGSYKPLISATVAKATSEHDRNLAFSLYYWIVNVGAFVFPVMYVIMEFAGLMSRATYYYVFLVSAIMVSLNILIALFVFKEVPRSGKVETVKDALINIKVAFQDRKFVVMLLLQSGFWMLYASMLNALPLIVFGFKFVPIWFTAMLLGVFNPLTIIALGIPISKFTSKVESLKALIGGVMLYVLGIAVIGFMLNWVGVIIGTIISSIGEFMVAPGYLSFVSKMSTKEKVSAYIGCNFISYLIGLSGGTVVIGLLASYVGADRGMPHLFYGILMAFGLLILMGFILYYRAWGVEIIERAKKISALEGGPQETIEVGPKEREPMFFRIYDHKASMLVPLILIPVVIIASFAMGTNHFYGTEEGSKTPTFDIANYQTLPGPNQEADDTLQEGEKATETMSISLEKGQLLEKITVNLTWTDEDDYQRVGIGRTWENQPDQFTLEVSNGANFTNSVTGANQHGESGELTITFDISYSSADDLNGTGDWTIDVTLDSAGDMTNPYSPLLYTDTSNSYHLSVTTEVYEFGKTG